MLKKQQYRSINNQHNITHITDITHTIVCAF